jgi:hypothetical protein
MKYLFVFLVFLSSGFDDLEKPIKVIVTTDSTIMSGNYSNTAIWSNGTVPSGASKNIVISNNTFVVVDENMAVNSVIVRQHGNIIFGTNKFLNNICLNYEPDSIIENNNKTVLYSSLITTCTDSYPPPIYAKKTSCSNTGWNDSTVVTDKTKMSGCWSNPKTFNTNSIPNGNTKQVYAKEFFILKIDTSVVVKRFVSRRATVRWTKGASINGISHQNYHIY